MKKNRLTKKERLAIIAGIALLIIGYFSYATFAGTKIGISLSNFSATGNSLATGLVGWWTFDGNTITSNIGDSSGNGNNGYFQNGMATSTAPGRIGQGLYFPGPHVSTPVFVTQSSSINIATTMTFAFWVKSATSSPLNDFGEYFRKITFNTAGWDIQNVSNSRDLYVRVDTSGGLNQSVCSNTPSVFDNQWHHIVIVLDASQTTGTCKSYKDGVLSKSDTFVSGTGFNGSAANFQFAGNNTDQLNTIDDVRMYNRTLSAAEAKRLYDLGATTHMDVSQQNAGTLPGAPNPNQGLLGYWTFDGNTLISNVADSSGNGKTMYMSGFQGTSSATFFGKIGQALHFRTGLSNKLFIPNDSAFDLSNTSFSMSAWVRPDESDTGNYTRFPAIINKNSGADTDGWQFRLSGNINNPYALSLVLGNGSSNFFNTQDGGGTNIQAVVASSSLWYHVGATFDNVTKSVKFYVNGVDVTGFPQSLAGGAITTNSSQIIIGNNTSGGGPFPGAIDDVRVYTRALSAAEMKRLYDMGATTHVGTSIQTTSATGNSLSAGLTGYWTFDGRNMVSNVADSSGNGRNLYLGRFTSTTTAYGKIGQALYFNGSTNVASSTVAVNNFVSASDGTMSVWIKPDGTQADTNTGETWKNPAIISDENGFLGIFVNSTTTRFYNWDGNEDTITTSVSVPGQWTHLVWVHTGGVFTAYKNGVQVGSTASGNTQTITAKFLLGRSSNAANVGYFRGAVDDMRIYNRALSAAEVNRLYQLGN